MKEFLFNIVAYPAGLAALALQVLFDSSSTLTNRFLFGIIFIILLPIFIPFFLILWLEDR